MNEDLKDDEEKQLSELEEADFIARVKRWKREADKAQNDWRDEARESFRFVAGQQWTAEEQAALEEAGRPAVVFNRVAPILDAVAGAEVANRTEARLLPRTPDDGGSVDVQNTAIRWVRDNCDAEDEESDAFLDVLICGVGWTEHRLDYDEDPDGKILVERIDPLEMRWDPMAQRRNLADASYVMRESWRSKDWIARIFPDANLDALLVDGAEPWASDDDDPRGELHTVSPIAYEKDATGYDKSAGLYRVMQVQWIETEPYVRMRSPESGALVDLEVGRVAEVVDMYRQQGVPVQMSPILQRRKYRQAFVAGEAVLDMAEAPSQAGFSLQAITGKRDRDANSWFGLVRPMRDPQKWANKFFSQILHMVNTNAKGGMIAETSAITDVRRFERDWARTDSIVYVNDGAISNGKLMPKPAPQFPTQPESLMSFSINSIRDVSGVNLEMLGMAAREQPGILEAERKRSAMMLLSPLFDALRLYRKRSTRVLIDMIREYISDGRMLRIVGNQGAQYVPLTKLPDAIKYDVIVDDAPTANDVRERSWVAVNTLLPILQGMGVQLPPDALEYAPIPSALAEKLKMQMIQASQQPQQASPEIQALQMQQQIEQMKAQNQAQIQQMKLEADSRMAVVESNMDRQKAEMQLALERQKAADQLAFDRERLRDEIVAELQGAQIKARADVEKAIAVEQIRRMGNVASAVQENGA